jgi:hypothetical protein
LSTDFEFRKVGECLYRYSSNGVYYARFKTDGKEIRRSLETTDRAEARRKLAAEKEKERQTDRSQGKLTLRELCDRWLKTIQNSKPKTLEQKSHVAAKVKEDWPGGSLVQVGKIKPSDCDLWLARCTRKSRNGFCASSRNAHVQVLKEIFAMALRGQNYFRFACCASKVYQARETYSANADLGTVQSDHCRCSCASVQSGCKRQCRLSGISWTRRTRTG